MGRIINAIKQLSVPIEEMKQYGAEKQARELERLQLPTLNGLKKAEVKIEAAIRTFVGNYEAISKTIALICTVKGVGFQTALSLYVYTKGFTIFENAKQLACYCGVVPFSKSSGTGVRSRPHVSRFANRKLKSLLHLCAMAALRFNKELKEYYERKIVEGKNKMSVINAIRNKLLQRIFAVVRDHRKYVETYHLNCAKPMMCEVREGTSHIVRFAYWRWAGFLALNFNRRTEVEFCTSVDTKPFSPPIANTMLPAGLF